MATSRSAMRSSKSRGLGQFAGAAPISSSASSILLLGCSWTVALPGLASSRWGWALFGAAFRAACYGAGKRGGALPRRCRARFRRGDLPQVFGFSSVLQATSARGRPLTCAFARASPRGRGTHTPSPRPGRTTCARGPVARGPWGAATSPRAEPRRKKQVRSELFGASALALRHPLGRLGEERADLGRVHQRPLALHALGGFCL